jgi:hypothetical protein
MVFSVFIPDSPAQQQYRRLSIDEYKDKMKAGWIGQMVGVGWGGPTEFKWKSEIIPEDQIPQWKPEMVNQFGQDDIYVEMTFLRSLELYGLDVSIRQAGIDFANSGYPLWHANRAGRDNLRAGIAPPDSGHPQFNQHADDIDYQIEADFAGLIAPGLPNTVIQLGEVFGRLMNYGDGLYGGQFVGGMYAEAFFETDPLKIIEAGLQCIPAESQYAEAIRDVMQWYKDEPNDWQVTWEKINQKYQLNPDYRRFSCNDPKETFNIDAKINGAYIVMGLLYGKGDFDQTIVISTRCGQDSDCNPSNAGGVLFTTVGFSKLPERFTSALDEQKYFSHTAYNFDKLITVSETLVRQAVEKAGGRIEKNADGVEEFVIPVIEPKPGKLEQCWEAGPIANSRFTDEEMAKISSGKELNADVDRFIKGWKIKQCGQDMDPGLREEFDGRKFVLITHPLDQERACILYKTMEIPAEKKTNLLMTVGHHPQGDWTLIVKANGKEIMKKSVGAKTAKDGWMEVKVDLSKFAGTTINLELLNQASGWAYEAGYWDEIHLQSE